MEFKVFVKWLKREEIGQRLQLKMQEIVQKKVTTGVSLLNDLKEKIWVKVTTKNARDSPEKSDY